MRNSLIFWRTLLCAFALVLSFARVASAQSQPTTHNLTFSNVAQSVDAQGRIVVTANVQGDLPGTLTLALVVGQDGRISGGEWAINVSYTQFGPASSGGDGDPSESLVQLGVIKGSIGAGSADLTSAGLLADISGTTLNVTGATMQFAGATSGSGTLSAGQMNDQSASSGTLTVTF